MTSYNKYDILKPSVSWKIWKMGGANIISEGGSDGLDPALQVRYLLQ